MKVYGIDVSHHQGRIDWPTVAAALRKVNGGTNPGFAILRVGYSSKSGKGGLVTDGEILNNLKGCTENGVPFGIYYYCYDQSADAAVTTTQQVIQMIRGYKPEYPIFYDVEYEPFNTGKETDDPKKKRSMEEVRATNTAMIQAALETLENAGYYAVVYCSRAFFTGYTNLADLAAYDKWEAAYTATDTDIVENGIWQYSSKNPLNIPGFGDSLDCDVSYKDYPAIIKRAGLNGWEKGSV